MTVTIYILITIIILLFITIVFTIIYFNKNNKKDNNEENMLMIADVIKSIKDEIRGDIRETRKELDNKIYTGQKDMKDDMKYQSDNSQKMIKEIYEHLSKVNQSVIEVKEGSKQVVSMTEQLTNLEKVLTNQKQRGNWGESSLELILSNYLNGHYQMQYKYKNNNNIIVDAVIFLKDKILPIDSKFSLDNYRRCIEASNEDDRIYFAEEFKKDMKKRIEETGKYIDESNEGTTPFVCMFIPSEAVFYDINSGISGTLKVDTEKLLDFAKSKKVHIVSPSTIFAFIHLIWSQIKDQKIEKEALEIKKKVEELGKHIIKYDDYMNKLGKSLSTTVNQYNDSYKELKKIDKDVYKITGGIVGGEMEILAIDKPDKEE